MSRARRAIALTLLIVPMVLAATVTSPGAPARATDRDPVPVEERSISELATPVEEGATPPAPAGPAATSSAGEAVPATEPFNITGRVVRLAPDGSLSTDAGYAIVELVRESDGAVVSSNPGSTFAFYGLAPGSAYHLRIKWENRPTIYSGNTHHHGDRVIFVAGASDVVMAAAPSSTASGSISFAVDAGRMKSVYAYSLDQHGELRRVSYWLGYRSEWSMSGFLPGRYLFLGVDSLLEGERHAEEFYEDTQWVEDATWVEIGVGSAVTGIDFALEPFMFEVYRLAGTDRYETAVEASRAAFEPGIPVLYLASGANWPDALSAAPAAAAQGGTLLLTRPDAVPAVIEAEIRRLAPERVIIVGSSGVVSEAVRAKVASIVPDTTRIGGADRYETSQRIVADAFRDGSHRNVFLATGSGFADALSAAPIAGRAGEPVLLIRGMAGSIDPATAASLRALGPERVVLVGSPGVISSGTESALAATRIAGSLLRVGGADRFETSQYLNWRFRPAEFNRFVFFANGLGYADALGGATVASAFGAPLFLVRPSCVPEVVLDDMWRYQRSQTVLLGGESVLNTSVARLTAC